MLCLYSYKNKICYKKKQNKEDRQIWLKKIYIENNSFQWNYYAKYQKSTKQDKTKIIKKDSRIFKMGDTDLPFIKNGKSPENKVRTLYF